MTRGQRQWNAYVEAGKDRKEQVERYKEAPEEYQEGIAAHMRVVRAIKARTARIRADREKKTKKRPLR